ncbi:MAG: hypothetical protein ACRD0K_15885 [Egibacteraceae bacterium]
MTWMERGSEQALVKVVTAVVAGFLLAAGELNHVIVVSLEIFAAFHAGAPFGYVDWLGAAAWAALGNTLGGIAFVTVLSSRAGRPQRRRARAGACRRLSVVAGSPAHSRRRRLRHCCPWVISSWP